MHIRCTTDPVLPIEVEFSLAEREEKKTEIFDEETFEPIFASGTRIHGGIHESAISNKKNSRQVKERL